VTQVKCYQLDYLPDASDQRLDQDGSASVPERLNTITRDLMSLVSGMPAGSVFVTQRLVIEPDRGQRDPQQRVRYVLEISAADASSFEVVRSWFEAPQIQNVLPFRAVEAPPAPDQLTSRCHLVRDIEARCSSLPDEASSSPGVFYLPAIFEAATTRPFQWLDALLAGVSQPVQFTCSIFPRQIEEARQATELFQQDVRQYEHRPRAGRGAWSGYRDAATITLEPEEQAEPGAGRVRRGLDKLLDQTQQSMVGFEAAVEAESATTARTVLFGIASAAFKRGWQTVDTTGWALDGATPPQRAGSLQAAIHQALVPPQWGHVYERMAPWAVTATVEELQGLVHLPYSRGSTLFTMPRSVDPPRLSGQEAIIFGHELQPGAMSVDEMTAIVRGAPTSWLTSHLLAFGTTGAGKTLFLQLIIIELQRRGAKVPTLGLELVKTEAGSLKHLRRHSDPALRALGQQLQIFTVGADTAIPFCFNPLAKPFAGLSNAQHAEDLVEWSQTVWSTTEIFRAFVRDGLHELFVTWSKSRPPTLEDLLASVQRIVKYRQYSNTQETDFLGASRGRIQGLQSGTVGSIFRCRQTPMDFDRLLQGHTVLQFDPIGDAGTVAALVFRVLQIVRRFAQLYFSGPRSDGLPNLVLWLDEVHVLTQTSGASEASDLQASPHQLATQALARLLEECRALGVAVILSDQHPTSIDESLMKSAGTVWCGRQLYPADQQYIAQAMGLSAAQQQQLLTLSGGKAFLRSVDYQQPVLIQTRNPEAEFGLGKAPHTDELLSWVGDESWLIEVTQRRLKDQLLQLGEHLQRFAGRRRTLLHQIEQIEKTFDELIQASAEQANTKAAVDLREVTERTRQRLADEVSRFRGKYYDMLIGTDAHAALCDEQLQAFRNQLIDRIEKRVAPPIESDPDLKRLDEMIELLSQMTQ
jgi:hypothetical protein